MGLKMVQGSSSAQSNSVTSNMTSRVSAYKEAMSALMSFYNESELKGKAYTSAKNYADAILIPLIQGGICLSDYVQQETSKIPMVYSSYCSEDLDEDDLQDQIKTYQSTMDKHKTDSAAYKAAEDGKTKAESKLEKLREFESATSNYYSAYDSLASALDKGLDQIGKDFKSASKNHKFPSYKKSPEWVKTVDSHMKARNAKETYESIRTKAENGEDLSADDIVWMRTYLANHPDAQISDKVKSRIYGQQMGHDGKVNLVQSNTALPGGTKPAGNTDFGHPQPTANQYNSGMFSTNVGVSSNESDSEWVGGTNTIESPKYYHRNNNYFGYSAYQKYATLTETSKDGIFQFNFNNGVLEGVGIDLNLLSANIKEIGNHGTLQTKVSLFGHEYSVNIGLGHVSNQNWWPEITFSAGEGEKGKYENEYGLKLSTDVFNGILGAYQRHNTYKTIDNTTTTVQSYESGYQTGNVLQLSAIYHFLTTGDTSVFTNSLAPVTPQ